MRYSIATVALGLSLTAVSSGQGGRAELFGTVVDPLNGIVVGARVQAQEQSTAASYVTRTDDHGEFHLAGLPIGEYTVKVESQGFRVLHRSGVILRIADRVALSLKLEL